MIIDYWLDETDVLTFQLYIASNSWKLKKKRLRYRIVVPIIHFVIGVYFYIHEALSLTVLFGIIGLLWFYIYPLWENQSLKRHLRSKIRENFKNKLGIPTDLQFNNDLIVVKQDGREIKYKHHH